MENFILVSETAQGWYYAALLYRLKISEYEVHWLMDVALINCWACLVRITIFLLKPYSLVIKSKQTST